MNDKFVIIDGSSFMYRAFYALPLLSTADGQYTNAVYGVASMLTKLIGELQPKWLAVAFDKGKITFRNELYDQYKATRKQTPGELSSQIPLLHEMLEVFGVALLEQEGFEADDIIGTLATKAAAAGHEVIVVTGDRDALQLIGDRIDVMITKKGITEMQIFDAPAFREKYGIDPIRLIDLKGLMGDASDNIPGVPGVGEKTALKLLTEYGSLENVLEHIEDVSGKKLKERLTEHQELALLSKKLATIVRDMDLELEMDRYVIQPDVNKVRAFCQRYEFKSVLQRLDQLFPEAKEAVDSFGFGTVVKELPAPEILTEEKKIAALAAEIEKARQFVFFPLWDNCIPQLRLRAIAVVDANCEIFYVESSANGWENLIDLFQNARVKKITHDLKPLYNAAQYMGFEINGAIFDTMLAAYLLEPAANAYGIGYLMERYLAEYENPETFEQDAVCAAWSASCIRDLHGVLEERLSYNGLQGLYEQIELPLLKVLASMENAGIAVNREALRHMSADIAVQVETLLEEIYALCGSTFNVNSPKQLGEILFERLNLPATKKTRRGYSTDAEVLEKLIDEHPVVEKILEYRMLTKLKSTYLDGLEVLIHSSTGRIHTNFNQTVTATGRLSSSDPNLQNIPIRTEAGRRIREFFIPADGYRYLLSADYSQIELRVLAHMSQDKNFVEAFTEQQDIHARTASEVFGVPMDLVSDEMRRKAKAVNFGIVYGISDYGLSRDLGVSRKEAGAYIESYFEKCAGVKAFIDHAVEKAHKDGFVTTLFGRKRALPEINSTNYNQRSFAERMAMNTPIQGTAADIIKKAMIDVYAGLKEQNLRSRILLQVHDELVMEVDEDEVDAVCALLRQAMPGAAKLRVPLTIDIHLGETWAKAK